MDGFSKDQERCLKHCILRGAVNAELRTLGPELTELPDTLLLKLLHERLVVQCPLFVKRPDTLSDLRSLSAQHPKLAEFSKKGMQGNHGAFASLMATLLSAGFLTPNERADAALAEARSASIDLTTSSDGHDDGPFADNGPHNDGDKDAQGATADAKAAAVAAAVEADSQTVLRDLAVNGGATRLAEIFETATDLRCLPAVYRRLMRAGLSAVLGKLEQELCDTKNASRASMFYHMCPRRTIYFLLNMSNPMNRISGLANLFLARPLNMQSGLQKIVEYLIDCSGTRAKVKAVGAKVDPRLSKHVSTWVEQAYDATASGHDEPASSSSTSDSDSSSGDASDSSESESDPSESEANNDEHATFVRDVLLWRPANAPADCDAEVEPTPPRRRWASLVQTFWHQSSMSPYPSAAEVDRLTRTQIRTLHKLITLEMRLKDKVKFVEIFGDEQLIALVRALISMLAGPLAEVYEHAHMASLINELFEFINKCATVSEKASGDKQKLREGFRDATETMAEALYQFNRNIVVNDESGTVKDLIDWALLYRKDVSVFAMDLPGLLSLLSGDQRQAVVDEVNAMLEFEKRRDAASEKNEESIGDPPATPKIAQWLSAEFLRLARSELAAPTDNALR